MKKSRNTFFQESNFQSYDPNIPYPNNPSLEAPFKQASNFFYQGPMPNNYTTNNSYNDMENRLAKIERQLNRMDYRISKLENASNIVTTDIVDNSKETNMYMI